MKSLYVIAHVRKGCLQGPEMVMDAEVAKRRAVQVLLEDGDIEGSDVGVYEVVLRPLHVKMLAWSKEIAELAEKAAEDGIDPKTLIGIVDICTAFQPMTGWLALCEDDLEREALSMLEPHPIFVGVDKASERRDTSVTSFQKGRFKVDWEWIGEGNDGDYDEDDPTDAPLLRADLTWLGDPKEPEHVESCCTLAHRDAPTEALLQVTNDLFDRLGDKRDGAKHKFQHWTWKTNVDKNGVVNG